MLAEKAIRKLRPLGRHELYHHIRNQLGFYNCVGSTGKYVLPRTVLHRLGGLEEVIFRVLKNVICQHPIMGVSVMDEGRENSWWIRLERIDLRELVQLRVISGGQEFIEDVHQKTFDRLGELPLWRVVVAVQQNGNWNQDEGGNVTFDVGFFFDHTMGDGLSGAAFHLDFLDALNALATKELALDTPMEAIIQPPELELLPSVEMAFEWPPSTVLEAYGTGNNDPKRWVGPPMSFSTETPVRTRLLTLFLDASITGTILRLCRKNDTTITPFLVLLIACQLAKLYPSHSHFRAAIPFSLRRFTGIDKHQMVDYVSGVTVDFSTDEERRHIPCNFMDWKAVRSCKAVIDSAVKSPKNQTIAMCRYIGEFSDYLKEKVGKKRDSSFELSNVGFVEGDMGGDEVAKLKRLIFSQSANVVEPPYTFSVACVKDGDMAIALSWQEGTIEEDEAEKVMKAVRVGLWHVALDEDVQPAAAENKSS